LLLRCASGEVDPELGEWWTEFMQGDTTERESLLNRKPAEEAGAAPKRRRRRGGRGRSKSPEDAS
jgi:poly(A) polymerase